MKKMVIMNNEDVHGSFLLLIVFISREIPSGAFDEVIRTGRQKHNYLPEEVMGEAFEGELVPVKQGSEVIGCVICTYSVDIGKLEEDISKQ